MSNQSLQRAPDHEDFGTAQIVLTVAICFCAGGLYGWSALVSVIESVFSTSTEQAALVFSVSIVSFSLAVFAVPRLSAIFTGLSGCALFGVSGAVSLGLATMSNSYELFLLAFSVGFGFCSGAIYINALTIASSCARPTLVTPVMVAAFSLGGAVFGPLWRVMVSFGWELNTLLVLASALVLSALVAFVCLPGRADINSSNVEGATKRDVSGNRVVVLLLWLVFAFGSAGGLMVLGLASKIIDIAGGSVVLSSAALAGIAVGNTAGRLSVGVLAHIVSPAVVALMSTVVVMCGLTVTGITTSAVMSAVGLIATATGYGLLASAMPTLVRQLFGQAVFAHVFSIIFTAWGVAGLVSPWVAGAIFDNTGNFDGALLIAFIATIGACLALLTLMAGLKRNLLHITRS